MKARAVVAAAAVGDATAMTAVRLKRTKLRLKLATQPTRKTKYKPAARWFLSKLHPGKRLKAKVKYATPAVGAVTVSAVNAAMIRSMVSQAPKLQHPLKSARQFRPA